jgi:hypothetical protein
MSATPALLTLCSSVGSRRPPPKLQHACASLNANGSNVTAFVSSLVAGVLGSSQWVLTYGQGALNEVGIARRRWDRTCVCLLLSEPVGIGAACAVCSLDFRLAEVMAAAGSPAGCSVYR